MSANVETLSLVIPVYNEEAAIETVIEDWTNVLSAMKIDYHIHTYNDGSKDKTAEVLANLAVKYPRLVVHNKTNSGHGPTILKGYHDSVSSTWVFQVDSDNELRAASFEKLWKARDQYDFLIGIRDGRLSPLPRKVISLTSRLTVRALYGSGVWDVNSPYRLMRTEKFKSIFNSIPGDTFAPNVIIAAMACRQNMRIFEIPVPHAHRQTGEVSIKKWKLLKAAARSFLQTLTYRFA